MDFIIKHNLEAQENSEHYQNSLFLLQKIEKYNDYSWTQVAGW